jgi:hypothetical protein
MSIFERLSQHIWFNPDFILIISVSVILKNVPWHHIFICVCTLYGSNYHYINENHVKVLVAFKIINT